MMRKQMSRLNKNESGYTLAGVLMVFIVLEVLGMSIMMLAMSSVKTSTMERNNEMAFYVAEAGLNQQLAKIDGQIKDIYQTTNSDTEFYSLLNDYLIGDVRFEQFEIDGAYADISISEGKEARQFEITSSGYVNNQVRVLETSFEVTAGEPIQGGYDLPKLAVFTDQAIQINGGYIYGNIATQSKEKGSITFGTYGGVYDIGQDKSHI